MSFAQGTLFEFGLLESLTYRKPAMYEITDTHIVLFETAVLLLGSDCQFPRPLCRCDRGACNMIVAKLSHKADLGRKRRQPLTSLLRVISRWPANPFLFFLQRIVQWSHLCCLVQLWVGTPTFNSLIAPVGSRMSWLLIPTPPAKYS